MRYFSPDCSLRYELDRCVGCQRCVEVCPHRVFVMEEGKARLAFFEACMECGACARNCPASAISVDAGTGCAVAILNGILFGAENCCGGEGSEGDCC